MPTPASATSVGAGRGAGSKPAGSRAGSSTVKRKGGSSSSTTAPRVKSVGGGGAGMWRFYTEDSPGIKIGPVPVLVMSLLFIALVFMLHIWGKYTRS